MKPISKLTKVYNRWRQRLDDIQHQDGYDWAKKAYYEGALSIRALLDAAVPITCAFDRGVLQATIDIERDNTPEPEFNEAGEPVGVPFMVEYNPGQPHKVHRWTEDNPYIPVDPEKEKAAKQVEEEQGLRPRQEQVDRRCVLKGSGFGWTKVKPNTSN